MTRLYVRAPGERRPPPPGVDAVLHLDEDGIAGLPLHHNLPRLFSLDGQTGQETQAALLTAAAVWAADKLLERGLAPDAWTREITLELPAAPRWCGLAEPLSSLLNFLTGDRWTLKFREERLDLGLQGRWRHPWQPDAVVLFSGGLDSLAGAVDLLAAGRRVVLVSHYDFGQLAQVQQTLAAAGRGHFGPDRCHHLSLRLQFPRSPELTLRSRSFLYLTLGMAAAAAFGPQLPVVVPENGWISLNPPLTVNRLGTLSTRTTHPLTLAGLTRLWQAAGLEPALANPYQGLSKGELLAQSRDPALLKRLAPLTVSCARPVASRWQGQGPGACGYCYPCLVRRAALHRLGADEAGHYRLDALSDPGLLRQRVKGGDLRALLLALKTWQERPAEVMARLILAGPPEDLTASWEAARRLLAAGFQEMAAWLGDKGGEWIFAYLDN